MLHFHDVPSVLSQRLHVVYNLQLLIKHQQRIVHVGDVGDKLCLYGHLIVLSLQQGHLRGPLGRGKIAKEVGIPTGADWQRIGLGGLAIIPRRNGTLWSEREARKKSQLGSLELGLCHIHIQCRIEQVGIIAEGFLNQHLQLGVGEHRAPGNVGEARRVIDSQGIGIARRVAHKTGSVNLRTLVFSI